jgi:putative transposase
MSLLAPEQEKARTHSPSGAGDLRLSANGLILRVMQLTAKIKLQPTSAQHALLLATLEAANATCNGISGAAWEHRTFRQFKLHKLVYDDIRAASPLGSQMVVRAIAKVTDSYKKDRKKVHTFRPRGSFAYDDRLLTFDPKDQRVSIWTLAGRQHMSYVCGKHQQALLQGKRGEAKLCYSRGDFYLLVACEVEPPQEKEASDFLGVDLGIANIAADSDGLIYSGKTLQGVRHRYQRLRSKLQRKGTRSAKRLLRKRRQRERRFNQDVNHCISKHLAHKAQGTGRGIALENLKGIRDRVTVRKSQRRQLHGWAFSDLRLKIVYKAKLRGVPIVLVDPRNTSRTCIRCSHIDPASRKSQSVFLCTSCGYGCCSSYRCPTPM